MIGGPDETRLLRKFTDLYPVTSRPVINESETLRVEFGVALVQIRELVSSPFVFLSRRMSFLRWHHLISLAGSWTTDPYKVPDAVPPIHAESYHVTTDKVHSIDGGKFRSILATIYNQSLLAERKHVAIGWC